MSELWSESDRGLFVASWAWAKAKALSVLKFSGLSRVRSIRVLGEP
jgi:hypothetical protein